jgi:ABC-2 type transport system permease protein
MIMFPLILVFLLGNLLENMDTSDDTIETMKVAYVVEAHESYDLAAIDTFLEEMKSNDTLIMKETDDFAEAKNELNKGDLAGVVVFKDPLKVEVHEGLDSIQNRALNIIFNTFATHVTAIDTLYKEAPQKMANLEDVFAESSINDGESDLSRSMLDYYAVTMIVMIIFMGGGIGGATVIYDNRMNGTLARSLVSPKSRQSVYIQTVLGSLPQSFIQVLVVMIPSVLVFGAHYAESFTENIILFCTFVVLGVAINAIFSLVGIFVKNNPTMLIMPILWVLMFMSGTFSKEIYIEGVTPYTPTWLVQNAAFDLTVFGEPEKCFVVMAVSATMALIATAIGSLLFKRGQ